MDTSGYITDNNIENIDEMREKADNYLTALAQIYDEIFEFDLKKGTVSRVYGSFLTYFRQSRQMLKRLMLSLTG